MTSPGPGPLNDRCARARQAGVAWQQLPVRRRLRPVHTLRHLLAQSCDRLCAAARADVGKPPVETVASEVLPLADACRFLERQAARLLRPRRVPPPASAAALAELLAAAGFPPDLIQVLEPTREAGQELIEAAVDHVVFTGSAATGRLIARRLGERLVSSTLELSGCDPQFVLDDADVDLAARAAWFAATANRGQTCIAARRALVQRPVYPAFCEALAGLAAGAPPMRLALEAQVRQAARLVADARAHGARLLTPEQPAGDGMECTPAVVADVRPDMALYQEASFAPLLAVLPFDDVAQAVRLDEACPYHLGASVFTARPARARELAAALGGGMVAVNDVIAPTGHPATPFGGRGASGWGVTQGAEGLLEMTVPQVVSTRGGRFRPHFDLAPGAAKPEAVAALEEVMRGLLQSGHAPSWRQRWAGFWRALRAARRLG
jgi:acyl-CoA reductase-like NAD-dependent aldehyde dehydrogenase